MKKALHAGLILLLVSSSFAASSTAKTPDANRKADSAVAASGAAGHVGLENFDVRRDPETLVLNGATTLAAKHAPADRTAALDALMAKAPMRYPDSLQIELHDSGIPKSIANTDGFLTPARSGSPDAIAREFLTENSALFGLSPREVRSLDLTVDDLDRTTGVTYLKYEQMVRGVPVFDSEIGVTITAHGEVAIVNQGQTLPGANVSTKAALSPEQGIVQAFALCGVEITADAIRPSSLKRDDASRFTYYTNPLGVDREDVMFQKTVVNVHGDAVLAYRAYVDKSNEEWYDTLVDANTGELLVRFNIVRDLQGSIFTRSPNFARTTVQFAPLFGVGDPWLAGNVTTGNNVDAYLDRDANNSADSTTTAATGTNAGLTSGRADATKGNPAGELTFAYTSGTAPTSQQAIAVANLFYFNNYMHDWMYSLGFTESARNFQSNNFGRGGAQNDPVRAEAQDGSGTNNANFATPADGSSGRMQQYLFTGNRDSSLDGDVVLHEYGHGVSNRLIGNGSGLGGTQSGAMGEGWSDYWACSNYNDGVMGEYVVGNTTGIRRAPYTVPSATVHDSYADVGSGGFEVHNDGEIWAAALFDLFVTIGKTKADKIVLDGMKNTVTSPSMVAARTGIITACQTNFPADVCAVWTVFARHGLGNSASGNDGTSHNAASDLPASCGGTPPTCSSSSSPISSGQTLSGSLATTDCTTTAGNNSSGAFYDTFTFAGTSGQQVTITMNSSAFDTYLRLKNSGGTTVASDDDGNGGTNSKITFTLSASGNYSIESTSYSPSATGSYTVTLTIGGGGGGGNCVSGTLSGTGAQAIQPNNSYYQTTATGTHTGQLTGPSGSVDFDLYLQKWNGFSWANVASGTGPTTTESVTYNGTAGYYRWRIYAYSGGGAYNLCTTRP